MGLVYPFLNLPAIQRYILESQLAQKYEHTLFDARGLCLDMYISKTQAFRVLLYTR